LKPNWDATFLSSANNNTKKANMSQKKRGKNVASSSGHDIRPTNDQFRPHDRIHLVVSVTVPTSSSDRSIIKELCWVSNVFDLANMIELVFLYRATSFRMDLR
jgi:hypothetical protein